MIRNHIILFIYLFFLFGCLPIFGQQNNPNIGGNESAIALYRESVGSNSSLYKGEIYAGLPQVVKGHPFFTFEKWQKGTVEYRGNIYQEVPMLYDIYQDKIVVLHSNNFLRLQLLESEVSYFSFSNHSFYHLTQADFSGSPFQTGFYEMIYEGEHTIFVKRKKIVEELIKEMVVKREFKEADVFMIEREGTIHLVRGRGSVLNLLKDRKKIVKKGMRKSKIKFRRDPEHAIVKMVEFYEKAIE